MKKYAFIFILGLCARGFFAQKYNFVNWSVEDGLIQSQASFICQDKYRQLWIGTEGGASCFDGKKFIGYTVRDGLTSNHINTILCDKVGNLWFGTNYGISVFNGRKFKQISFPETEQNNVDELLELEDGRIYGLINYYLLEISTSSGLKRLITGDSSEKVTTLTRTKNGNLLATVYGKGIYTLQGNQWNMHQSFAPAYLNVFIRQLFITSKNDTLILSNQGLWKLKNGTFNPVHGQLADVNALCIAEDSKQNLWLGTDNGAYKIEEAHLTRFDQKSGFTDNSVHHIFKDAENNLWFAVNADGVYKFSENTFTYYDKSSGFSSAIIMGVVQTSSGKIYTGGYGGGLYEIHAEGKLEHVDNAGILDNLKINCLYADGDEIWIGTTSKGIYVYEEKRGLKRITSANAKTPEIRGSTCFLRDRQGNLLIGSDRGLFIMNKAGTIHKPEVLNLLITTLKQFDNDHAIVATSQGLFLLDRNYHAEPFNEKVFGNSSILCLSKYKDHLWIGTTDKGVFNWNFKTGKIIQYTTSNGLPSNFIYSMDVSNEERAWIGTGFGISNLKLDASGNVEAIKNYGRSDGLLGMECNHNSLLRAADSSLWFGTTKGLFHFNPSANLAERNLPLVLLRSVKLFSSEINDSSLFKKEGTWFRVPEALSLSSKQNHITFELSSIYFTNPEDVMYTYKLDGIDKNYSTSSNPNIIYPSLPPGKYVLRVRGITKSGLGSENEIQYPFEIRKAFYQTRFFQVFSVLFLLATGALLAYLASRGRQKRKQKAKELLEKIREEEFMKLRQRTAEDFHDEMGNNLTRISVLTDILKSKLNGQEQEVGHLVQQIKENTVSLYNGSKDIIWSLNSNNDGLYEITEHIKDIGNELFHETAVDFNCYHNITEENSKKLKLDYSRNLTMIFKEAYSNILKHSGANSVNVTIRLNNEELHIHIHDNGKGFDPNRDSSGNGIKNMKNRSERMNGLLTVTSSDAEGTDIHIRFKNLFT